MVQCFVHAILLAHMRDACEAADITPSNRIGEICWPVVNEAPKGFV